MHTEPDENAADEIELGEEDFGDTELDRDDTHGMPDEAIDEDEQA